MRMSWMDLIERGEFVFLPASGGKRMAIKPRKISVEHISIVCIEFEVSKFDFVRKEERK